MSLKRAGNRDKKRQKHNKMIVTGKSLFLIQEIQYKRANEIKKKKDTEQAVISTGEQWSPKPQIGVQIPNSLY